MPERECRAVRSDLRRRQADGIHAQGMPALGSRGASRSLRDERTKQCGMAATNHRSTQARNAHAAHLRVRYRTIHREMNHRASRSHLSRGWRLRLVQELTRDLPGVKRVKYTN